MGRQYGAEFQLQVSLVGTADRDRFADGRYELERSFARHFKIEHDGRQTNYTTLIDSHQARVLWESPSKAAMLQQQKKPTKVVSKTPKRPPLQQPILHTDTFVPGSGGSFRCNFCDKEFSHAAALDHWNGSHSSQDVKMLVYTNTATGTNVRIQEMFRLVGRCRRPACGKYVVVSGANPLHLKNIFRMHYKNEHGEAPDNFNAPDHFDVVKFIDKSVGGGNVYDVTKKTCSQIPDNKKSVPQIFTDINKKATTSASRPRTTTAP